MAVCETWLIRDENIIIRDGGLLLCEDVAAPIGGVGYRLLRKREKPLDENKKRDIEIAAILMHVLN